jgi:adenosylhomocysteine nucleosidase
MVPSIVQSCDSLLIVMALESESARVFEDAGLAVAYCGVGKINAALALTAALAGYHADGAPMPTVANFGSAGSRRLPSGTLVECHEFVQRDMDARGLGFALGETPFDTAPARLTFARAFLQLPTALCGSGDSFATGAVELECDVLDMEAYALAKVCRKFDARFVCAKFVTDGADHAAVSDWRANVHKAARQFFELYEQLRACQNG